MKQPAIKPLKNTKACVCFVLLICMLLLPATLAAAEAAPHDLQLEVNGNLLHVDVPPLYYAAGKIAVPLRAVLEELGAVVKWDQTTRTISVTREGDLLLLQLEQNSATLNGIPVPLEKGVIMLQNRALFPVRQLAALLNVTVTWDKNTQTVSIAAAATASATIPWDEGTYTGPTLQGKPHGKGIWTHADGSRYEGGFKEGLFHGQGTTVNNVGAKYSGDWKEGLAHGQGTMLLPDYFEYTGEWWEGRFHGQGTLTFVDGEEYVGYFAEGKPHGPGKLTYPDGTVEEGVWQDGIFQQPDA